MLKTSWTDPGVSLFNVMMILPVYTYCILDYSKKFRYTRRNRRQCLEYQPIHHIGHLSKRDSDQEYFLVPEIL